MPTNELLTFIAVSLALAIVPGPAVLYIATRSATQGRMAGVASVLGVATGGVVHVLAAAIGLSVLLMKSAVAMEYVRIAGAGYLIYLGIQKLRSANVALRADAAPIPPQSLWKIFRDGVVVNTLNPKTALFFLSFLPQFADPRRGDVTAQLVGLGCLFLVVAFCSDSMYALAASVIASAVRTNGARAQRIGAYSSAAIYLGLGVAALASKSGDGRH